MEKVISERLEHLVISPALRELLLHVAKHDLHSVATRPHCAVVSTLGGILDASLRATESFSTAWQLMYAAICRLDALQDDDPAGDGLLATLPSSLQYQLVFSSYLLAMSFLDDLSPDDLPASRIDRLRKLWTMLLFRIADGQYQDLTTPHSTDDPAANLMAYQELTHAKAGPVFALAFGGAAALASDDEELIEALIQAGDLYGALVQYHDDVIDNEQQPDRTLTLAATLLRARPDLQAQPAEATRAFLAQIYHAYTDQVAQILEPWPAQITAGVLALFPSAFGHHTPALEYP